MARRKNTITRFIEDIVDDTKDFVDDLLDRAKDVEEDLRDAAKNVVDDDDDEDDDRDRSRNRRRSSSKSSGNRPTNADIKALHAAIAELTATVNALAEAPKATTTRSTKVA